ncbi:hypothetical protein C8R44DRAFT_570861, partial [Mycena epipterygia]
IFLVDGRRRRMAFDPKTTVGRVKELVWSAWPAEPEWQDDCPPPPRTSASSTSARSSRTRTPSPGESAPSPPTIVHLFVRS